MWGTRWRRKRKPIETRTVVDRTLGGDVLYVSGRFSRFKHSLPSRCSLSEWKEWQCGAVEITASR